MRARHLFLPLAPLHSIVHSPFATQYHSLCLKPAENGEGRRCEAAAEGAGEGGDAEGQGEQCGAYRASCGTSEILQSRRQQRMSALATKPAVRLLQRVLPAGPEKAPKPGAQEVMPRAMRKMLQLKAAAAAAAAAKGKGRAQGQAPQPPPQQPAAPQARHAAGRQADAGDAAVAHEQGDPPAPAAAAAAGAQQKGERLELPAAGMAAKPYQPQQGPEADQAPVVVPDKKLKDKKKDFLRQKKLKKRQRQEGGGSGALVGKEAEVAALAAVNRPAFGEQAKQPLKVQLKRKHWAGEGTEQGGASKRCTQIFERQMATARAAAAAVQAARDDGAGQQQQQRRSAGKTKKQLKQQQQDKAQPDEAVRQQLIDAYRQQKLQRLTEDGRTPLLSATAQSLAALVRRDAGKASFH